MRGIFINYRRSDSASDAGRLADHLRSEFGQAKVFLDVDSIDAGTVFPLKLSTALLASDVLIVVIGPQWACERLHSPGDFVRQEIETGLQQAMLIIPVLTGEARLPRAEQLPSSLSPLLLRNAHRVRHESFSNDSRSLIRAIRGHAFHHRSQVHHGQHARTFWAPIPLFLATVLTIGTWYALDHAFPAVLLSRAEVVSIWISWALLVSASRMMIMWIRSYIP